MKYWFGLGLTTISALTVVYLSFDTFNSTQPVCLCEADHPCAIYESINRAKFDTNPKLT